MDPSEFRKKLQRALPAGAVFSNPGGGTSTVLAWSADQVCYKRGNSRIYVRVDALYEAYAHFAGHVVSSSDLRVVWPHIFDSKHKGHSCNCTFLFSAFRLIGVVTEIRGRGVRGDPFVVDIPK